MEGKVIEETKKLIETSFIREEKYPDWIASIVPVKKKNWHIRICVDFRDLNKTCPKDNFPLPVMEIMIDNTSSYEVFSFMDGSLGIIKSKWIQKMKNTPRSGHRWVSIAIRLCLSV